MKGLQWLAAWLAAALVLAPLAALAAPQDAVFNKEHVWAIDVDRGACAASRTLPDGATFLFRAQKGKLSFGYFAKTALRVGHAGRLETEAYGFDFAPSCAGKDQTLYFNGDLDARAVAALRLAREVRILTDGRLVVAMTFEGTGFESALDGVLACSRGESGWWGPGLGQEQAAKGEAPASAKSQLVLNKEGFWRVGPDRTKCFAYATFGDDGEFMLLGEDGKVSFGVGVKTPAERGRRGSFETEAYAFDFQPSYTKAGILYLDDHLNANALAALRLAKDLRITVDGREVMKAHVEGTGLDGVLDALVQCSQGRSGWWGAGAKVEVASGPNAAGPEKREPAAGQQGGKPLRDFVMNKENTWGILVGDEAGACVAQAAVDDHLNVQILAAGGRLALGVGSDVELPRGRRGRVETDSYAFDFTPRYDGKTYMNSDELFDSAAVFALHRAKWLRASVDGHKLVDVDLTETGFPELLDSVAACSRGERGWWGEGAKRARN